MSVTRHVKTLALTAAAVLAVCAPSAFALPAGRGYEKVSPADKDGNDIINGIDRASFDGNAAAYASFAAFANSPGGAIVSNFYSQRTPTGWTTRGITPPMDPVAGINASLFDSFSEDASSGIIRGSGVTVGGGTPGTINIYRTNPNATVDAISIGQPPIPPGGFGAFPNYDGGSADLSLATFDIATTPALDVTTGPTGPAGVTNPYAGNGTDVRLVSVLPDGTAEPSGGTIGSVQTKIRAVSEDGSRIFWTSSTFPTNLYVRLNGTSTDLVSESQRTPPDPAGPQDKTYQFATPDGAFAYFTSSEKLTNNSQAEPGVPDLYRYNVATGALDDLTTADPDGAGIVGVLGTSDSGNRIYFAATGALAPGATDGNTNLYVLASGQTTFITTLDPSGDFANWSSSYADRLAHVSASGQTLLFGSRADQGTNNDGFMEFYVYDLASDSFGCISCYAGGAVATGDATLYNPPSTGFNITGGPTMERRSLSNDGTTAFFTSPERLLGTDTNGKYDVYMWKQGQTARELVSTGQSSSDSGFVDASESGNDAFFLTRQKLVGIDNDNEVDLYDARVGGGIAEQNPAPPVQPCQGDDCQGPAPPETGPPPNGTSAVNNPVVPPPPDCSSLDNKAEKKAAKVTKLQKKVAKASGKQKKKLKKKLKKAKKQAKKAQQAADQCNQG